MIDLSGLSAAYPGYQAQEKQTAETQKNQYAAREAAIKLLGARVLGQALGGGPQPPAPGQASVPNSPAPAAPAAGVPAGGVPVTTPQPVAAAPAPGATGALPEMTLQALTSRILQRAPGIANHPEVLLAALERAAPMLDRQGRDDLAEARNQFIMQRIQIAKDRLEEAKRHHDLVSSDKAARESGVSERFNTRQETGADKFNRLHPNAPAVGVPSPDITPPSGGQAPPLAVLKPNTITTFANGQRWTIGPDGQPKQVQ